MQRIDLNTHSMHALLIHQEIREARCLQRGLKYENITCDLAMDFDDAYQKLLFTPFDALIVHSAVFIAHKNVNGSFQRLLRAREHLIIILFGEEHHIPQQIHENNKHHTFFFPQTISTQDISQRLKAFMYKKRMDPKQIIRFKDLKIDLRKREVWRKRKRIFLRNKEFALLEYFLANAGNVLTRPMILENVWDRNTNIMTNTIDVHVASLRKKIDYHMQNGRLKTIHGVGYKLE